MVDGVSWQWLCDDYEDMFHSLFNYDKKAIKRYTDWIRAIWFQEIQEEQEARAKAESNNRE